MMDGEESNVCDVLSGVPQGSVLGAVLILLYINDIITDVDSKINLFADDCALYREIKSAEDASALQNDLDRLYRWSCDGDMDFNVTKCFSMSVTLKRNFIASEYYISDDLIEKVQSHKYLGVYICNETGTQEHIFEWGAGDEFQVHMKVWKKGVRGGAPEKFCNPRPIIQWETPCSNIDMHPVLVENSRLNH